MQLSFSPSGLVGVQTAKVFFPNQLGALVIDDRSVLEVILLRGEEDNFEIEEGISWETNNILPVLEAIRQIKPD